MTMTISIFGTGAVARSLAPAFFDAGHSVFLGSRQTVTSIDGFTVLNHQEAVTVADVIVNATTGSVSLDVFRSLDPDLFDGKILLDVANANADVPQFQLRYPESSLAERLQEAVPGARVVKALNTVSSKIMSSPQTAEGGNVFLSADDADAKATVRSLLNDLGWADASIIDLGPLASARGPESYFVLFGALMPALGTADFNIRVVLPSGT